MAIRSFRHKGLERWFVHGDRTGIAPQHAARLRLIVGLLHAATEPRDLGLPGLRLHPLRGPGAGRWALQVSRNWRVTFAFIGKDVHTVDYEDYH